MKESRFQHNLIKEIETRFPGSLVYKMDARYRQGTPDILVLYGKNWATLECKNSSKANKQPNQEYYVGLMNEMSFSRIVTPENKEEVLNDLQRSFKP